MRIGACLNRKAATSAKVNLPRLRRRSAIRNVSHRPADQKADRVDEAVVATGHHRCRNTQERCRRHVVTGNRQTVLETRNAPARCIKICRRLGSGRCPFRDEQREQHKNAEHADCRPIDRLLLRLAVHPGRRHTPMQQQQTAQPRSARNALHGDTCDASRSFQQLFGNGVGQDIELAVGAIHVVRGDHDREHDDAKADRNAHGHHAGAKFL